MCAVNAPGAQDVVGPVNGGKDLFPVVRPFGCGCALEPRRIGFTEGKQVADPEPAVAKHAGAPLATLDSGIVRKLGCRRRIQHDVEKTAIVAVPDARQRIAVPVARRIDRLADPMSVVVSSRNEIHDRKTRSG